MPEPCWCEVVCDCFVCQDLLPVEELLEDRPHIDSCVQPL